MAGKTVDVATLDGRHIIHPQTNLKHHYETGPRAVMVRGEGAVIYDSAGNEYIDGLAGLWNINVGHGRQELAQAAYDQMSTLAFTSGFSGFTNPKAAELGHKLAELLPGDLNTVMFASGGSESNESAFKLARLYWKTRDQPDKTKIVARRFGYHGVTLATTAATGIPVFWEVGAPMPPGFSHAMAPNCYRCDLELTFPGCGLACANDLESHLLAEDPTTVAAVIVEPVQGAGGVIIPPPGYLAQVREICDRHNVLLIADEVICGFGRTGTMFGVEHEGVVPDMLTFAKGITSGYIPLGGVALRDTVFQDMINSPRMEELAHGFTYTAHPAACAVALANIEVIEKEGLVENSRRMGERLLAGLQQIGDKQRIVGNVRGRGLIAGLALMRDTDARTPFAPELRVNRRVFDACKQRGLIPRAAVGDVVALAPPLIVTEAQVDRIVAIVDESLTEVTGQLAAEGLV